MKIKKGDKVIVLSGKDKGKTGEVAHAYPKKNKVLVPGVNVVKHHQKARRQGQKGQMVEKPMPIHVSNVMIVDVRGGKGTRIGIRRVDGRRERIAKKSGAVLA